MVLKKGCKSRAFRCSRATLVWRFYLAYPLHFLHSIRKLMVETVDCQEFAEKFDCAGSINLNDDGVHALRFGY